MTFTADVSFESRAGDVRLRKFVRQSVPNDSASPETASLAPGLSLRTRVLVWVYTLALRVHRRLGA